MSHPWTLNKQAERQVIKPKREQEEPVTRVVVRASTLMDEFGAIQGKMLGMRLCARCQRRRLWREYSDGPECSQCRADGRFLITGNTNWRVLNGPFEYAGEVIEQGQIISQQHAEWSAHHDLPLQLELVRYDEIREMWRKLEE